MSHSKRLTAGLSIALLGFVTACSSGETESNSDGGSFPTDEIDFLIPYGPGGISDNAARVYADYMSDDLEQRVVPENREGAAGAIAMNELSTADADGYTTSMATLGTTALVPNASEVEYTKDDILPVGGMIYSPSALLVRSDSEYEDIESFYETASQSDEPVTVATVGSESPQGIEMQRWRDQYDANVTVVPMDSDAELVTALLGDQVDAYYGAVDETTLENIEADEFQPLMYAGPDEFVEGVPSTEEAGYPALDQYSVWMLAVPAETPSDVISSLEASLERAHQDESVRETIGEAYFTDDFQDGNEIQELIDEAHSLYSSELD